MEPTSIFFRLIILIGAPLFEAEDVESTNVEPAQDGRECRSWN